jgi:hypothetical protein
MPMSIEATIAFPLDLGIDLIQELFTFVELVLSQSDLRERVQDSVLTATAGRKDAQRFLKVFKGAVKVPSEE